MTTCNDANAERHSSPYDVLGRLLLAIRGTHLAEGKLDYWRSLEGGVVLEWIEGPHASEARAVLMCHLADSGSTVLRAEDLGIDHSRDRQQTDDVDHLCIDGIPVQFRALSPVGWSTFVESRRAAMRQALGLEAAGMPADAT